MVALTNILISGIISFSNPWLTELKLNTNWIFIGTIIHMSKYVPFIWNTRLQVWGVRNEIPLVSVNPNEGKLVQFLLIIDSKVYLPQNPQCKFYLRQFCHTETSGFYLHHTNEPQAMLLQIFTCVHISKVSVCTENMPRFIYTWLQKIEHYLSTMQQFIIFFNRMGILFWGTLEKIQLHHYYRNAISSILDLTTIFRISIDCNILWQTGIYPVTSDPIPYGYGFILQIPSAWMNPYPDGMGLEVTG